MKYNILLTDEEENIFLNSFNNLQSVFVQLGCSTEKLSNSLTQLAQVLQELDII